MDKAGGFIEKHGLWSQEQRRRVQQIKAIVKKNDLSLFRIVWADPHGAARAKTVTLPAFLGALENGYNINVATSTLDASGARVFSSFVRGGGMNLDEMTGSPNLIAVPDPTTFRILPWEPKVGWILCDEYFVSGTPFHFSPRHLLRKQIAALEKKGLRSVVGLEIEWYLFRQAEDHLTDEHIGRPGLKGRAIHTYPTEAGYSLHSESNFDQLHLPIAAIADAAEKLGLPLRSIENEWGPGQVEFTFAPRSALETADNLVLFRSAARQIARRMGYLATFMCRPGDKGYPSSGWHLHQSLVDGTTGRNRFMPTKAGEVLSPLGKQYLGGLLRYAVPGIVFANPTVNAYRRFRPNSLAPDRVAWGSDHRGVMLRVLGAAGDPASRIENRAGEPSANPYLYIASQLVAGLKGINSGLDAGPADTDPYATAHTMLPKTLGDALNALEQEPLFTQAFGPVFMDYYMKLKRTELGRYETFATEHGIPPTNDATTRWEQDEYFDFF